MLSDSFRYLVVVNGNKINAIVSHSAHAEQLMKRRLKW